MLRRKKGPDRAFSHSDNCKILAADPTVEIQWNETRTGHWEARCQCGVEYLDEPAANDRFRLDPLDPKTGHHAPQCEFASETNSATLKVLLKARERDGYWWVECGSCEAGWQVPFFAESVGVRR
jgi:hypothetical protein